MYPQNLKLRGMELRPNFVTDFVDPVENTGILVSYYLTFTFDFANRFKIYSLMKTKQYFTIKIFYYLFQNKINKQTNKILMNNFDFFSFFLILSK